MIGYYDARIIGILSRGLKISVSMYRNFSAVMVTFNNIGPGFGMVGPSGNFSMYSDFSKCVMIFDMLAGRLEIYPTLVLMSKRTWRK